MGTGQFGRVMSRVQKDWQVQQHRMSCGGSRLYINHTTLTSAVHPPAPAASPLKLSSTQMVCVYLVAFTVQLNKFSQINITHESGYVC